MQLSRFNGQYVNHSLIHNPESIFEFLNSSKVYSNLTNFKSIATKLINYERKRIFDDKNKRQKVYAIQLLLMLPKNINKSQKHELIKDYMLSFSKKYKQILYIYAFETIGKGLYCRVIIFERQLYKKKHTIVARYKRDMYINKKTGRTTSCDDPDSVHICKKGEVKKDKAGNIIEETIEISPKKYRYFSFKDNKNIDKKMKKFIEFKDKLTKKLVISLSKVLKRDMSRQKLTYIPYGNGKKLTKKIVTYNTMINRINIELELMQKFFRYERAFDDEESAMNSFNHIFYSILNNIKNNSFKLNKSLDIKIDPNGKDTYEAFENNIRTFENMIKGRIMKWYVEQFYDSMFDDYYRETKHPFSKLKYIK